MRMRAITLALIVFALVAAGNRPEVSFQTLDDEIFVGHVVELRDEGVLFATEKAEAVIRWERIHRRDRYELRASVTPADDAGARLALAKQCLADTYYGGARKELERALALGHSDHKAIEKLMEQTDLRECDRYWAQLYEAMERRDYDEALATITEMAKRFPNDDRTRKARDEWAPRLVRQKAAAAAQAEKDRKEAEKAEIEAKQRRWLDRMFAHAEKLVDDAKGHLIRGRAADEKGSLSRAREGYTGAEERLLAARRGMIRVRRATREGADFEKADRLIRSIERKLLDVYLGLGALEVGQGNYKAGVIYVDRALLFDPVNPEALRLSEEIRENWIRRRLSSITNAHPRTSGG